MSEWNTGSAILIVGTIYLRLALGLDLMVTILLVFLGIFTWGYLAYSDERTTIIKAQARYWEARATNEERKSR